MNHLAQSSTNIGNLTILGPVGFENSDPSATGGLLNRFLSITVGLMTVFGAVWFLIMLITAAYAWMNSGGDKVALETARAKMIHGVIGLTIILAAVFTVGFIGEILGIKYAIDPGAFLNSLLAP